MKISYNGRDRRGRFVRRAKITLAVALVAAALLLIAAHPFVSDKLAKEIKVVVPQVVPQVAYADITMEAKVEALKADIVERLKGCESAGASEADGLIVFDTNGKASIGLAQFQVATVVHYYQVLYGKEITRKEAIEIALDEAQATELTLDIIFKEKGGVWNWKNCATKLQLAPEIEVIKKLTQ